MYLCQLLFLQASVVTGITSFSGDDAPELWGNCSFLIACMVIWLICLPGALVPVVVAPGRAQHELCSASLSSAHPLGDSVTGALLGIFDVLLQVCSWQEVGTGRSVNSEFAVLWCTACAQQMWSVHRDLHLIRSGFQNISFSIDLGSLHCHNFLTSPFKAF